MLVELFLYIVIHVLQLLHFQFLLVAVSCNTMNMAVMCHYRFIFGHVPPPTWCLDGQKINVTSSTHQCNETVSQVVYDYSGLRPGEHVFHGKYSEGNPVLEHCCGSAPEVYINLTVAASKISMHLCRVE